MTQASGNTIAECQAEAVAKPIQPTTPTVMVIDDNAVVRESIESLLRSVGYHTTGINSAREFQLRNMAERPNCLIVDVRLPGLSGLDFQIELAKAGIKIPVIFVTGYGDISLASRAIKAGAVDFLTKPFRDQDLLDAVATAIQKDHAWTKRETIRSTLQSLFESLTDREREIAACAAAGLLNKQIAAKMGLSEVTVKQHRGKVMNKLHAKSLVDLVRIIDALGISCKHSAAPVSAGRGAIDAEAWSQFR
jgi:FixJ family two-component response regulator